MSETANIILGGETYECPIVTGSENEKAIDISKLRAQTGYITIDTGFKNTGSTKSAITFLDGEKGILRYRGYPIEQLADQSDFLEVAYLLIYGDLPSKEVYASFKDNITNHTLVHEDMRQFIDAYPAKSHPMGILAASLCTLSTFYPESQNPSRPSEAIELTIHRLIAKIPTLSAWAYKNSIRHPLMYPQNKFEYCENFLYMMFANPSEKYYADPVIVSALNKLLILHADHEQNCSTSTVRMVASGGANLFASVSAGVCALWGPSHGGANMAVIKMLEEIHAAGDDGSKFIEAAKKGEAKLMGFGHRVYKNYDPRAKILGKSAEGILASIGMNDPLLDIARKLEQAALEDEYFVSRKLYPNVDFYSGIILKAIGIPVEMFTVMFAIGRMPG